MNGYANVSCFIFILEYFVFFPVSLTLFFFGEIYGDILVKFFGEMVEICFFLFCIFVNFIVVSVFLNCGNNVQKNNYLYIYTLMLLFCVCGDEMTEAGGVLIFCSFF